MLSTFPALSEHRRLRLAAFFLLYVSQGIPIGLSMVAIPAWLAANGVTAAQIGFFVGTAFLPWSLKLVNGMVMDRFCYRPMGRRRAWVIGAQVTMVATLLIAAALNPGPADITLLTALCFMLNLCATFNDVGVDGMAVDLVPEEEREQTNAFMGGGQVVGVSATAALAAVALVSGGLALAAIISAIVVALLTIFVTLFRERPGERFLPWTVGTASAECLAQGKVQFLSIMGQLLRGLFQWRTLMFLAGAALIVSSAGMADVFGPSFSVSQLGWTSEAYSNFYSVSGLIIAVAAMVCIGPLVSRFGTISVFIFFATLMLVPNLATFFIGIETLGTLAMQAYITLFWGGVGGVAVLIWAWSMNLTNPAVAASQFALFMAIPNFARSAGSGAHGLLIDSYGYEASFLVTAISIGAGAIICLLARYGRLETIPALADKDRPQKSLPETGVPAGLIT